MFAALAALVLAVPGGLQAAGFHPCVPQGVSARCGTIVVPENRSAPEGRQIRLNVVVIPARSEPARPDAFTYLAGGPGGAAATEMPSSALAIWPGVHERHDILLVDQRGTGGSNALTCPAPKTALPTDAARRSYVRACLRSVHGDPAQYGTRAAMDDLEAVRLALGYRSLDVYGTSYGATAAQVYLERHPRSVRTLFLDGGTFLDVPFYARFARNGERALDLVEKRCAADGSCAQTFPGWRTKLTVLVKRWNAHPLRLSKRETVTGDGLAGVVQQMTQTADGAREIPLLVSRAAAGNYGPLRRRLGSNGLTRSLMYWTIMCNEPWVGLDAHGPWGTYLDGLTRAALVQARTVCSYLPRRSERQADWRRPHSTVPVLVLAGAADPQDPLSNLPGLEAAFPNSRAVVAGGQGHGVGQLGCLGTLVARVVARGTVRGLDTSCARLIEAPPFALR